MSSFAEVMNAINPRLYGITPTQTTNNGLPQQTPNGLSPAPLGGVGVSTTQLNPMTGMPFTQQQLPSVLGAPSTGGIGGLLSGALTNLAQTPAFQTLNQVAMGQPQQTQQPYTPPNYGNYGFDQSMVDYLNRQRELSVMDAGIAYNYDPATQTFTGGTMGGPVTKTLAQMQAEIANQRVPNIPQVGQQTTGGLGQSLGGISQDPFSSIFGSRPVSQQPMNLDQVLATLNAVNPGASNPAIVNPVRPTPAAPVNLSQAIENVRRLQPSWYDRFNSIRKRAKFSTDRR